MRVPFGSLMLLGAGLLCGSVPIMAAPSGLATQQVYHLSDSATPVRPAGYESDPNVRTNSERTNSLTVTLADEPQEHHWPKPQRLVDQIESLEYVAGFSEWMSRTLPLLDVVASPNTTSDTRRQALRQLESRSNELPTIAGTIKGPGPSSNELIRQSSEVYRLKYRLDRRLAVWNAIAVAPVTSNSRAAAPRFSSVGLRKISFPELEATWAEYLLLEEYKAAFGSLNPDSTKQRKAARRMLARIYSPALNPEQAAYIQQAIDPGVIRLLKGHAVDARDSKDTESLLASMEQYETHPSSLTGYYLNNEYQNRLWSDDPVDQSVAQALETHFRNANIRLTVSEQLLSQLIPTTPPKDEPVLEHIQGARITGTSRVANQIKVKLVPDPTKLNLRLEIDGHVRSNTVARTKTFRILNEGEARIQVFKPLAISRNGVDSAELPYSYSSANQSVVDIESKLDDIPILGWLARRLAEKKLREDDQETDRLFRRKVARSAESRVQQEVEALLGNAKHNAYTKLFQPLMKMELEPHTYQMATTPQELVIRYRLAGRDQMAANTSRPQDSGNSLLSVQIHQSAINNSIARLGLNGEKFTSEELSQHLRELMSISQVDEGRQDARRQSAEFTFAHFDPIRIDFIEDRINIVLNLKSLKISKQGKVWKNLILTASYKIHASGMQLVMIQDDDGTRINKGKGRRLRLGDKAAISTVMKVLFKKEYTANSLPKKLSKQLENNDMVVSQLVVSDGWLGISINDRPTIAVQARPGLNSRIGINRRLKNIR